MAAREGRISEALFIYRQVDEHFPGGNGALMARLRSTDQELLTFQPDALPELRSRYRRVFEEAADMRLHEEALFKEALAEALFAPLPKALAAAEEYEQSYPRGVWQPIIRSQREELLRLRFQELRQANDCTGAITLLRPNSQFLDAAVTDTAFVPAVSACFQQLGLVAEERDLFLSLLKRHGNSPVAPLMLAQVVTNDLLMGDLQQGVDSASQFRQLYPADPRRQRVTEQLAQAQFSLGRYAEVVSLLQPFMAGGKGPETPESYYFLGRALLQQGNQRQGGDVLRRYLDATAGSSSPYRLDSYALRARALASQGNYGAALAESQTGLATGGERSDEFRYLVAWNLIRLQRTDEGRSQLQHLAKQGVDPVWRRLAQEGLAHLPELPLTPLPSAVSK
jgi:predicted Zn-dependent protease